MKYKVSADNQSVVSSCITDDYKQAISEYLWNCSDASASIIEINYIVDKLGNIKTLKICDNGKGICG